MDRFKDNTKKQFYLVTNPEGDYYEAVFSTLEEAHIHVDRRMYSSSLTRRLDISKKSITFEDLYHILEGEEVEELWSQV